MSSKRGQTNSDKKAVEPSTPEVHDEVTKAITNQTREGLFVIFLFRLVNALCVRTFFQPDEYFQALEPAWQMVYGDHSGAWLTWEWRHALRSSIHPAIFSLGYFIVESYWSGFDMPTTKAKWLLLVPKVLQTAFATLGDWYTWRLAEKLYGPSSAAGWSVLLITLLNPWQWYTATRTFSNCFETMLTIMALYYWPWGLLGVETAEKDSRRSLPLLKTRGQANCLRLSLVLAACAVLLRPTNVFIWLAIGTLMVTRFTLAGQSPLSREILLILFREAFLCGSFALGISLLVDHQYFGDWTFPPFTWLHVNVTKDIAKFYGQNDWHYFLTQGIPLLCTTITPFAFQGLLRSLDAEALYSMTTSNALKALTFVVVTTISALSLVSHKEIRFIQPLSPILYIIAAPYVVSFFTTVSVVGATMCPAPPLKFRKKPLLAVLLLVNVIVGGYLSWFHAAAPIQVMSFLRSEFEHVHPDYLSFTRQSINATAAVEDLRPPQELFALFLTPCHTTPWRSHLIYPSLHARALTCEPPLDTAPRSAERANYQDETRQFYMDPMTFMTQDLWPRDAPGEDMARYIVGFEGVEEPLRKYFDPDGSGGRHRIQLKEVWSAWNGLFTDDERKSGRLIVWATGFYDE
ncbi:glycosyltransferase family 22 protein [Xylariaceae sp. FL1019]|nr:glycosyltransferase family 22 protein [Xylariaceae sp. FL1019]